MADNHQYMPYPEPKTLKFHITSNVYDVKKGGWIQNIKQYEVIGETKDLFITRIIKTVGCDRHDQANYGKEITVPIGIHKSRLIKDCPMQLTLF